MFERFVQRLVQTYLRDYVNLDDTAFDSLVVSLWEGDISVNNVTLKKEALTKLVGDGIKVDKAVVESIKVQVPWTSLQSKPVVISLEGITILASIDELHSTDSYTLALKEKQRQLDSLNSSYLFSTEKEAFLHEEKNQNDKTSFFQKLATKILDNLQLVLKGFHIEIAHETSGKLGVWLKEFSLLSANSEWAQEFVVDSEIIRKLAKLDDFYFYFAAETEHISLSSKDRRLRLNDPISRESTFPGILHEELVELKVQYSRSPTNESQTMMKIWLNFNLIEMSLRRSQWLGITRILDRRNQAHWKLRQGNHVQICRPAGSVFASPKQWWKYAIHSILHIQKQQKHTRNCLRWRSSVRDDYIRLYKQTLRATQGSLPSLNVEEKIRIRKIEEDSRMDIAHIHALRSLAHKELKRQKPNLTYDVRTPRGNSTESQASDNPRSYWNFSEWWYGDGSRTDEEITPDEGMYEFTSEERDELLKAIGYDDGIKNIKAETSSRFSRLIEFSAEIRETSIVLLNDVNPTETLKEGYAFARLTFSELSSSFSLAEDRSSNFLFCAKALLLRDESESKSEFRDIIQPAYYLENSKVLEFRWRNERIVDLDVRLDTPLRLIFNRGFVAKVMDFFLAEKERIARLETMASESLTAYRSAYENRLEEYLASSKQFHIRVHMETPIILLPQNIQSKTSKHLVMRLGTFSAQNVQGRMNEWVFRVANAKFSLNGDRDIIDNISIVAKLKTKYDSLRKIQGVHFNVELSRIKATISTQMVVDLRDILSYVQFTGEKRSIAISDVEMELLEPRTEEEYLQLLDAESSKENATLVDFDASFPSMEISVSIGKASPIQMYLNQVVVNMNTEKHRLNYKLSLASYKLCWKHSKIQSEDSSVRSTLLFGSTPSSKYAYIETDIPAYSVSIEFPETNGFIDINSLETCIKGILDDPEGNRVSEIFQAATRPETRRASLTREGIWKLYKSANLPISIFQVNAIFDGFRHDHGHFYDCLEALYPGITSLNTSTSPIEDNKSDSTNLSTFCLSKFSFERLLFDFYDEKDFVCLMNVSNFSMKRSEEFIPFQSNKIDMFIGEFEVSRNHRVHKVHSLPMDDLEDEKETHACTMHQIKITSIKTSRTTVSRVQMPPIAFDMKLSHSILERVSMRAHRIISLLFTSKAGNLAKQDVHEMSVELSFSEIQLKLSSRSEVCIKLGVVEIAKLNNLTALQFANVEFIWNTHGSFMSMQGAQLKLQDKTLAVKLQEFSLKLNPTTHDVIGELSSWCPSGNNSNSKTSMLFTIDTVRLAFSDANSCYNTTAMMNKLDFGTENNGLSFSIVSFRLLDTKLQVDYLIQKNCSNKFFDMATSSDGSIRMLFSNMDVLLTPISNAVFLTAYRDFCIVKDYLFGSKNEQSALSLITLFVNELGLIIPNEDNKLSVKLILNGLDLQMGDLGNGINALLECRSCQFLYETFMIESVLSVENCNNGELYRLKSAGLNSESLVFPLTRKTWLLISSTVFYCFLSSGPRFSHEEDHKSSIATYIQIPDLILRLQNIQNFTFGELKLTEVSFHSFMLQSNSKLRHALAWTGLEYIAYCQKDLGKISLPLLTISTPTKCFLESSELLVNVSVSLEEVKVNWLSDAVQDLFEFYYASIEETLNSEPVLSGVPPEDKPAYERAQREILFDIEHGRVCFPSNTSNGVLLNSKFSMKLIRTASSDKSIQTLQARMMETNLQTCQLEETVTIAKINQPFIKPADVGITIAVENTILGLPLRRTVFISLDDLVISWELKDTRHVLEVLIDTLRNRPTRKSYKYKLYERFLKVHEEKVKAEANQYPQYFGAEYDIRVALTSLSLTLISGKTFQPVIGVEIDEVSTFEGSGKGGLRIQDEQIDSKVTLNSFHMKCFNISNREWEAVLEKCAIAAEIVFNKNTNSSRKRSRKGSQGTEIYLESSSSVRVNLSAAHIKTFVDLYHEAKELERLTRFLIIHDDNEQQKPLRTVVISNFTGTHVDIHGEELRLTLAPGETNEIKIAEELLSSKTRQPQFVKVKYQFAGFPEKHFYLKQVQPVVIELAPDVQVISSIDVSNSNFIIKFESMVSVKNFTDRVVWIRYSSLHSGETFEPGQQLEVDPNRVAFAPLKCVRNCIIYLRLTEFDEWRQIKVLQDLKKAVRLAELKDDRSLEARTIIVTSTQKSQLINYKTVFIEPPYRIWNLLTDPIRIYKNKPGSTEIECVGEVNSGGFAGMFCLDRSRENETNKFWIEWNNLRGMMIQLASNYYDWEYTLINGGGVKFSCFLDNSRSTRDIYVYARFWIVNLTKSLADFGIESMKFMNQSQRTITKLEETYENQRYSLGKGWSPKLLSTDRFSWSDRNGTCGYSRTKESFEESSEEWSWESEWQIDTTFDEVDDQGWQYSSAFGGASWSRQQTENASVRRRKWIRQRNLTRTYSDGQVYMQKESRLCVRLQDITKWSQPIDLTAAGTIQTIRADCKNTQDKRLYVEFLCHIDSPMHEVYGLLQKTNICRVYRRTLLVNGIGKVKKNQRKPLRYCQVGSRLLPNRLQAMRDERNPPFEYVKWSSDLESQLLTFQIGSHDRSSWSGEIDIHKLGSKPFCLIVDGQLTFYRIKVSIGECKGCFVAVVEEEDLERPLIKIENLSSDVTWISQKGVEKQKNSFRKELHPFESTAFAWTEPSLNETRMQIEFKDSSSIEVDPFDLGTSLELTLSPSHGNIGGHHQKDFVRYNQNYVLYSNNNCEKHFWSSAKPHLHNKSVLMRLDRKGKAVVAWNALINRTQMNPITLVALSDNNSKAKVCFGDILEIHTIVGDGAERKLSYHMVNGEIQPNLEWRMIDRIEDTDFESFSDFILLGGQHGESISLDEDKQVVLIFVASKTRTHYVSIDWGTYNLNLINSTGFDSSSFGFQAQTLEAFRLPKRTVYIKTDIEGSTRVVRISSINIHDDAEEFESRPTVQQQQGSLSRLTEDLDLLVQVDFEDLSFSVVDAKQEELCLIWLSPQLTFKDTNLHMSLETKLRGFRIDNQLIEASFLNILRPSLSSDVVPESVGHLSLVLRHHLSHFTHVHYFGINVAPLDCHLDADIVSKLDALLNSLQANKNNLYHVKDIRNEELLKAWHLDISSAFQSYRADLIRSRRICEIIHVESAHKNEKILHFEMFQIYSFSILFTYHSNRIGTDPSNDPIVHVMNAIQVGVQNINEAPIVLRALALEHPSLTIEQLVLTIWSYYADEIKRNMFTILGRVGLLGNPGAALDALGGAVYVFFNEPMQGIVRSPEDFGRGLGRGTMELLKGTMKSLALVTGGVADSFSKAIASVSFDSDYAKRKTPRKPQSASEGFLSSSESFLQGLQSGMTGVINAPREGARQEGIGGFFKGLGTGVIGAVTKPIGGAFEIVSKTTEGALSQTKSQQQLAIEKDFFKRKYPPRLFVGAGKYMPEFQHEEVILVRCALEVLNDQISHSLHDYFAHIRFSKGPFLLLFSAQYAFLFVFNKRKAHQSKPISHPYSTSTASSDYTKFSCSLLWRLEFDSKRLALDLCQVLRSKPCSVEFIQNELKDFLLEKR